METENKLIIKEVIVVEGKDDESALRKAVEAEIICTRGYGLTEEIYGRIAEAYHRCGIIIFTDPDYAGSNIRKNLTQRFPNARQAYLKREDATRKNDIGVENASPEDIREALLKAHAETRELREEFTLEDLFCYGLAGDGSSAVRDEVGKVLGIGYGNSKTFLRRLNNYGITREELENAVQSTIK